MSFVKLRVAGFKTFVEPTEAPIEPGLTGVVGPNGCGKSNLVEALRWVMGESSFKSLRASGMEDVIFAGSGGRPARNHAEVVLTLDNSARAAPEPFNGTDDIEVSRKISRGLGSTYRINGREVRARDVQLLFADASSGPRSPALVGQGRVGEIINARPDQRRRILEEAAGVAGLHARRHEAEQRLDGAEHNLARVEDVLGQLGQRGEALRRQAKTAERYRTLTDEIRALEALALVAEHEAAAAGVAEAERAETAALAATADAMRAQGEAARAEALAAHALAPARNAALEADAGLRGIAQEAAALEGEEARAHARLEELRQRLAQIDADVARETALSDDAGASLARLAETEAALGSEDADDSEAARAGMEARVAVAEAELAVAEAALSHATADAAAYLSGRRDLERRRTEADARLGVLDREAAALAAEAARLAVEAGAGGDAEALSDRADEARAAVGLADRVAEAAEAAHARARGDESAARGPAGQANARAERATAEARTLSKLLSADAARAYPAVVDLLLVEPGFETALGAALGDDLDAAVDVRAPARWAGADGAGDPPLPAGAIPLSEHLVAPPELARRLAQIGLVERADGVRLRLSLRPGQRLVSREGDLWRWDGFTIAAEAPTPAARWLQEKNRLGAVEREAAAAQAEADALRAAVDEARAQTARAAQAERGAREAAKAARASAEAARDAHAAAERAGARVAGRRAAVAEATSRVRTQREEVAAARDAIAAALAAGEPAAQDDGAIEAMRAAVTERRRDAATLRAEVQARAAEARRRAARRAELGAEIVSWTRRRDGAAERLENLARRQAETDAERAGLADRPDELAAQRRDLRTALSAAEAGARAASDVLALAETAHRAADQAARAALDALSRAREDGARLGARLEAAREKLADVAARIREARDMTPAELKASVAGVGSEDRDEVDARLARALAARERLGAVNLRAEQELAEIEASHGALAAEREDLTAAIARLRTGIRSLNQEGRAKLLTAFAAVDAHFRKLFETLFDGGEARLELVESDDPLEAGLEVIARPPGKKPQVLSLLSGGEQALTALALVFGVFLTNPAPVCVLDEVDAPLDDANVERFCALLAEMRRTTATRFLVVTHNPITMARMDRLLGVTMAERGVSQLVTVDLQAAERLLEAV